MKLVATVLFFAVAYQCQSVEVAIPKSNAVHLEGNYRILASTRYDLDKYNYLDVGLHPYYIQNPILFRKVLMGTGTFQERHLNENIARKDMTHYIGTTNAHRITDTPSRSFFGSGSVSGRYAPMRP